AEMAVTMRVWLQHNLPLHLWCRLGGRCKWFFGLYEDYFWLPLLRGWLNGKGKWEEPYLPDEESDFLPQSLVWICGDYMKTIKKLVLLILTYRIMTTNVYAASSATILSDTTTSVLIVFFLLALVGLPRR
ncbi:MAG: hypothetical protein JSV14_14340, partial [Deltaproteobacteria bacterium]